MNEDDGISDETMARIRKAKDPFLPGHHLTVARLQALNDLKAGKTNFNHNERERYKYLARLGLVAIEGDNFKLTPLGEKYCR